MQIKAKLSLYSVKNTLKTKKPPIYRVGFLLKRPRHLRPMALY